MSEKINLIFIWHFWRNATISLSVQMALALVFEHRILLDIGHKIIYVLDNQETCLVLKCIFFGLS